MSGRELRKNRDVSMARRIAKRARTEAFEDEDYKSEINEAIRVDYKRPAVHNSTQRTD